MKIDRLIGILAILLQKGKVTAPYLAQRFEVSRRTISRDLESLSRAGIPIVTEQGVNGGISIMEGYRIDRTLLTSADMQAILAGLCSLDSVSGTNRYSQLMEKLSAGSSGLLAGDSHILIDLSSWYKSSLAPKIELLHGAIDRGELVRFRYFAPGGESVREIEPYDLVFQWANWYVWGWCTERADYRLFKLQRMDGLESTGIRFEKRAAPLPDLSAERIFSEEYAVRALVSPEYKWRLVEEYGPGCFAEQPDGRLLFERGFSSRGNLMSWVLSFGGGMELLEPAAVRDELAALGRILCARYGKQDI